MKPILRDMPQKINSLLVKALGIIDGVVLPKLREHQREIESVVKEVVINHKEINDKIAGTYSEMEAMKVASDTSLSNHVRAYKEYCKNLSAEMRDLQVKIESKATLKVLDASVSSIEARISILEQEEIFEYDDSDIKTGFAQLRIDFDSLKRSIKETSADDIISAINKKKGSINASSIKGLIEAVNTLANNSQIKVSGSILEILNNGTSFLQGATRINFTGGTVTQTGGTVNVNIAGGAGGFTTLTPTETPDGTITVFTFPTATAQPSFINRDGTLTPATAQSGAVYWTWSAGLKQAPMTLPPTDILLAVV